VRTPPAVRDYIIPMRAATVLALLLLAACQPRRAPPKHTRVVLVNCRCADGTPTHDPSPVLSLDASEIREVSQYQVEVVDRAGRRRAYGRAVRDGKFVDFKVPVRLSPGSYFVRLNDVREYRLIVQAATAGAR
jgi:hypothetical protein